MDRHVVVIFGSDTGCGLNQCPMTAYGPFPTNEAAKAYMSKLPQGFLPHVLTIEAPMPLGDE
jgi:hypothetical protein